jgi:hypothetical protein
MSYTITNIRRGKGERSHLIYANVVDQDGKLCVSALLDYCVTWVKENV